MKINKFIGTLCGTREVFCNKEGEQFYTQKIKAKGHEVDIVFSEYLTDFAEGKVTVTGYIRSETYEGKLFTFIYAMDIRKAVEEDKDSMVVELEGEVFVVKDITATGKGVEILPIIVKYTSADGNVSVVHTTAAGQLARKLRGQNLKPKTPFSGRGFIKPRGAGIEVALLEVNGIGGELDVG